MLNRLQIQYSSRASFVAVYVAEAHAADEWPVGKKLSCHDQPKNLSRRCELARKFAEKTGLQIPLVVDSMDDGFVTHWGAWPFRFYGILNGKLSLKPQPSTLNNFNFELSELKQWLQQHCC
jgi:hypothetical protein